MDNAFSRAPKQLGDFGEGLVTYALIRKGFEVACVDHVGADLIAQRGNRRIAVSVKTRMFKAGSNESRGVTIERSHLKKLKFFAELFGLEPVFAQAVCINDNKIIHLFIMQVTDIENQLAEVKHGFSLRFGNHCLEELTALPYVDYSSWSNESIESGLFGWADESSSVCHTHSASDKS